MKPKKEKIMWQVTYQLKGYNAMSAGLFKTKKKAEKTLDEILKNNKDAYGHVTKCTIVNPW